MESVPLLWRTVTASRVGIEPMTILEGGGGLDCSVLCDGCACEEIEQSINETCMHKSKYYVYKCLSYMDQNTCVCIDIHT